jgi:tyrosine-protein kinase
MSRNFELLDQLEKERRNTVAACRAEPDPTTSAGLRPNVGNRTYEQLNKLVQRLFLSSRKPSRHVVFTGAGRSVGSTWICVHAAEVLCCQTAGSVCIVDAHTGTLGVREHFDVPNGAGFAKAIEQAGPIHTFAQRVGSNLWVVPADDSSAVDIVFSRPRVEARLLELSRQFDYVLLDAPPVAPSSEFLTLVTLAEGAVLVLKAGHTRRPAVRLAIEELETAGVRILGAVLNQRQYPIPEAIYKRL